MGKCRGRNKGKTTIKRQLGIDQWGDAPIGALDSVKISIDVDRIMAMTRPVRFVVQFAPLLTVFEERVVQSAVHQESFYVPEYVLKSGRRRSS